VSLTALHLVARRADGREPGHWGAEPLTRTLCAALGIDEPRAIVSVLYGAGFDRVRIAALASAVLEAARAEPAVAERVLIPAGEALAEMALAVVRSLQWPRGELPLGLAGSFLLAADEVAGTLLARLEIEGFAPRTTRVREPVEGALLLASELLLREANLR
jgi:N-acetylglucosamine kinase-like BadF-type ATPase